MTANNVKKFMRYHIPPEVKITHGLKMSSKRTAASAAKGGGGQAQIATALSHGGPRNMRSEKEQN